MATTGSHVKRFELFIFLASLITTHFLFAKGTPCDKSVDEAQRTWDSRQNKIRSTTPDYKIEGDTVKTLGFSFKMNQAAMVLQDKEKEFYVDLYPSPDKKTGILSLGSGESRDPERDLWLIDFVHKKTEPLNETGGSFTTIFWQTNQLFDIDWGGLGYEMSVFVKLGKNRQEVEIDDLLDVDVKRQIYVAVGNNKSSNLTLEVGRLFQKDAPKEQFELPGIQDSSEYMEHLPYVGIEGEKLVICLDKKGDEEKIEKMIFYPKLLKEPVHDGEALEHLYEK